MSVTFRYFAQPHEFSNYTTPPKACDFCGETRPYYSGPFFGPGDDEEREIICEDCLASGRLEQYDMTNNDGDHVALKCQLTEQRPDLTQEEIERLTRERTAELESRTPSPQTWQYIEWPAHCGDYCRYVKEIGQPELVALAADGDGAAYFAAHSPDISDIEHAREVWDGIRPDAPEDLSQQYSTGVYLFACLACDERIILWDCD